MKSFNVFILSLLGAARAVTVSVSATASHPVPTTLFGQMFENRAFQQVTPGKFSIINNHQALDPFPFCRVGTTAALNAWQSIDGATISVIAETTPVSSALPNALHVVIPSGRTGAIGFANTGYFGIKVTSGTTYSASFYYRFPTASSFRGIATVSLQTTSGQILGSSTVFLSGAQTSWHQISVQIVPTITASSTSNLFAITLDATAAAGQTINFAMLSLFPPTFKNRPNGMRVDIAEKARLLPLAGNGTRQLDHLSIDLVRMSFQISGLGLFEYLTWCEDLKMTPIMAIWSGFALGGTSVAEASLQPYIQQAADQINFVIGANGGSAPATLRASLGHPAPFNLTYVEVGNEDFFASSTYVYRWHDFVTALQAEFPQLHFIATSDTFSPILSPNPTEYDVHVYQTPSWFAQNSFFYDGFQRNGTKYFEGEYAAISTNASDIFGSTSDGRLSFPTMQSSTGEAAFMTGLERNSDIVFAASYAPLLNVSNTIATVTPVTFVLPFSTVASTATLQVIQGSANTSNNPTTPNAAVPVTSTINTAKTFTYNAPGFSVSVITLVAH
ncbi:hypothetical protein H0H93_008999 [Arthromyces matolae]|nr:hypothetical protein H0H93_008999 [Arthromyces matolae]